MHFRPTQSHFFVAFQLISWFYNCVQPALKKRCIEAWKLRRLMLESEVDNGELAKRLGVNRRCVQNLLAGCHRSWPLREKLNKFFGQQIFNPSFRRSPGRPRKSLAPAGYHAGASQNPATNRNPKSNTAQP